MNLLEILILAGICWLTYRLRAIETRQHETNGRLIVLGLLMESRAAVVAVEVGAPSRSGAIAQLEESYGKENSAWN